MAKSKTAKSTKSSKTTKAPVKGKPPVKLPGNYKPLGLKMYTKAGTQKWQANGPVEWRSAFVKLAGKGVTGEGVRLAMAYAVAHLPAALKWARSQGGK